jgi:hypothetical protein
MIIYLSIMDYIINNAFIIITTLIVGVLSAFIAGVLLTHWKKPKLLIEADNRKEGKLGFSVCVQNKEVKNATVSCNKIKYQWEKDEGIKTDKVDLRVNDDPISFYPFDVTAQFSEDLSNARFWDIGSNEIKKYLGAVSLVITEPTDRRIVYRSNYAIPYGAKSLVVFAPWNLDDVFTVRLRIVGEGLEEESDYVLRVGLRNLTIHPIVDGKPLMEYLLWAFEVKSASKIFNRKHRASFIY